MKSILFLFVVVGVTSQKCRLFTENDCLACLKASQEKQCNFCDPKVKGTHTHKCTGHPRTYSGVHGPTCPESSHNVRSTGLDCMLAGYPLPIPESSPFFGGSEVTFTYERVESELPNGNGIAIYKTNAVHPSTVQQYEKDINREHEIVLKDGEDWTHLKAKDKPFNSKIDHWIETHFGDAADEKKIEIKSRFTRTVLNGALVLNAIRESMAYPSLELDMVAIKSFFESYDGVKFPKSTDHLALILGAALLRPNTLIRLPENNFRLESTQIFAICTCSEEEDEEYQIFAHVLTSYTSEDDQISYQIKIIKRDCAMMSECRQVFCHDPNIQCNTRPSSSTTTSRETAVHGGDEEGESKLDHDIDFGLSDGGSSTLDKKGGGGGTFRKRSNSV